MIVGSLVVAAAAFAPSARADDHRRHDGTWNGSRHYDRGYVSQRHYYGASQPYYYGYGYGPRRTVIYDDSYGYGSPGVGITFAVGGHRHHHWHHR